MYGYMNVESFGKRSFQKDLQLQHNELMLCEFIFTSYNQVASHRHPEVLQEGRRNLKLMFKEAVY